MVRLGGLAAATAVGLLLSAVQWLPFLDDLRYVGSLGVRAGMGQLHLPAVDLLSWLAPNLVGNPALDAATHAGPVPNYNEATGFVGVSVLVLAGIGAVMGWGQRRVQIVALAVPATAAAGVVYGPLTPLAARLPFLNDALNERMLVVVCLSLCALGGLGLDAVLARASPSASGRAFKLALVTGVTALAGMSWAIVELLQLGGGVDALLPSFGARQFIGFWILVTGFSLLAAISFSWLGLRARRPEVAGAGLTLLILLEAAMFAGPYNPRVSPIDVPPANAAMTWLEDHVGNQYVAGIDYAMDPESSTLYGLRDVRGYEANLIDARHRAFWAAADPALMTPAINHDPFLEKPGAAWLAAAGVKYVLTGGLAAAPGTRAVWRGDAATIGLVPHARPFAYVAREIVRATSIADAVHRLARDPLGPTVVEGTVPVQPVDRHAQVELKSRLPGAVSLEVSSRTRATVVVLQSFWPGWVAFVDGDRTPILAANVTFQSVRVPAGHHAVTLRYQPGSVPEGAAMSGVGLLALLLLVVIARVRPRSAANQNS